MNHKLVRVVATTLALIALACVASGCGDDETKSAAAPDELVQGSTDGTAAEPPPIQVLNGVDTGVRVKKPTVIVVQSASELEDLTKDHARGNDTDEIQGADFKTRQIVGVFVPKAEPGSQLSISSVQENKKKDQIIVKATLLAPGKGCDTKGYPRYPYQIVNTRKMSGEPTLILEKGSQSGC